MQLYWFATLNWQAGTNNIIICSVEVIKQNIKFLKKMLFFLCLQGCTLHILLIIIMNSYVKMQWKNVNSYNTSFDKIFIAGIKLLTNWLNQLHTKYFQNILNPMLPLYIRKTECSL